MDWTVVFLSIAILLSLGFIITYFLTEGFRTTQADLDQRIAEAKKLGLTLSGDSVTVCQAQNSCGDCLNDTVKHPGVSCGWCNAAQACIPRSGMYRLIPEWLNNIINLNPEKDCPANPANSQQNFVYTLGGCGGDVCSTFKNCRDCAGALACGWSTKDDKCYDKAAYAAGKVGATGGSPAGGSPPATGGSPAGGSPPATGGSPPPPLVRESANCPLPVCSAINNCGECTTTTGCGYCKDTQKCISVDGNGSSLGGSLGPTGCAQGSIFTQIYQCPCSTLTNCVDCAQRPGCGFCTTNSTCMNMEVQVKKDGPFVPIPESQLNCSIDKIAESAAQCLPGAKMGNQRWEGNGSQSGDYIPSAAELDMAQNNMALAGNELNVAGPGYTGPRGAGSGAVSPPTTYTNVSGNGVLRRVGISSVPGGISRSADLAASPLEDYVKLLVRSELASEGIPMNEPFQVNETQALPNAELFLQNSTKTLLEKK